MPGGLDLGFTGCKLVLKEFKRPSCPQTDFKYLEAAALSPQGLPFSVMPSSCSGFSGAGDSPWLSQLANVLPLDGKHRPLSASLQMARGLAWQVDE